MSKSPLTERFLFSILYIFVPAVAYAGAAVTLLGIVCTRPGERCAFGQSHSPAVAIAMIAGGILVYAMFVEIVVAWPVISMLRRIGPLNPWALFSLGAVLGVAPYFVQCLLGGSCSATSPDLMFIGGGAGAMAALTYVVIRKYRERKAEARRI